jgi:tetratricopeptide (TPR) repeat protein
VSVGLLGTMKASDIQVRKVEQMLLAARKEKPRSVVLLMHLADLYDKRGRYDDSAKVYQQVLKEEPKNVVALNNLAWLMAVRDVNAQKALEYINEAIKGMGQRGDLLDTRATVYLALKETDKALADLREAVADSATPGRLFHLALAQDRKGNDSEAAQTLQRARARGLKFALLHPAESEDARRLLTKYGVPLTDR